jgi:hypothetical protein
MGGILDTTPPVIARQIALDMRGRVAQDAVFWEVFGYKMNVASSCLWRIRSMKISKFRRNPLECHGQSRHYVRADGAAELHSLARDA